MLPSTSSRKWTHTDFQNCLSDPRGGHHTGPTDFLPRTGRRLGGGKWPCRLVNRNCPFSGPEGQKENKIHHWRAWRQALCGAKMYTYPTFLWVKRKDPCGQAGPGQSVREGGRRQEKQETFWKYKIKQLPLLTFQEMLSCKVTYIWSLSLITRRSLNYRFTQP